MFAFVMGVGMHVDVAGFQFVVQNALAGVETVITGEHIGERAGQRVIQHTLCAEQLYGQNGGGKRTVPLL